MLFLSSIFIAASCTSQKKEIDSSKERHISPGIVKIIGKVVSIDEKRFSSDNKSPCGKLPCMALVKIDSVIGYGAGAPIIGKKDTILVRFAFTLSETTKDLFPNLDKRLPGLEINSVFKANVSFLAAEKNEKNKMQNLYQIFFYEKL